MADDLLSLDDLQFDLDFEADAPEVKPAAERRASAGPAPAARESKPAASAAARAVPAEPAARPAETARKSRFSVQPPVAEPARAPAPAVERMPVQRPRPAPAPASQPARAETPGPAAVRPTPVRELRQPAEPVTSPPQRQAPAQPSPLRLVSLRAGLSPLAGRRAETKDRIRKLIDRLQGSDAAVVALQGVWETEDAEAIANAVKTRLPYTVRSNGRTKRSWGSGLLVLSRFPLSNVLFVEAPKRKGERGEKTVRGLLVVDVERGEEDGPVRVVNAQLPPVTGRPPKKWRAEKATAAWSRRIVRQLTEFTGDGQVMLVGNVAPATLEGRGIVDALRCLGWRPVGDLDEVEPEATEADALPPLNPVMFHDGTLTDEEAALAAQLLADEDDPTPSLAGRAA